MRDGIAYIQRLKYLLDRDEQPLPVGVTVSKEMFEAIEHAYPALCRNGHALLFGIKVYRGEK